MGFSLVGNSGDTSSQNTVIDYTSTSNSNPQADQQNSGLGAVSVIVSPTSQATNHNYSLINPTTYSEPISIIPAGNTLGDSAVAALTAAQSQGQNSATPASGLSTLLSGDNLYYVIGAIILLFLI
jgi:hypothetical protein